MLLDSLVEVVGTLKVRISEYGDTLRQNETRTRVALIDPLLRVLGWDVADFQLVMPEYNVGSGRADYALLGDNGKPQALIEAKHLGETLESSQNVEQVFTYALTQQVKYAGLTDGNRWVLDDVSDFSGGDRRKLDISLSAEPAYSCALKLLLLWRPNLASGRLVAAVEPIVAPVASAPVVDRLQSGSQPQVTTADAGWSQLFNVQHYAGQPAPTAIRLPNGAEKNPKSWVGVLVEVAEYLVGIGNLTADHCPLPAPTGARHIVHREAVHSDGKNFTHRRLLSNGLFCEANVSPAYVLNYAKSLLQHCGVDAGQVWLKLG